MTFYRRKLPHWQPEGMALFINWRLHGSLPAKIQSRQTQNGSGKAFVAFDHLLDKATSGPLWLKDSRIAQLVTNALKFGESDLKLYRLDAFVIMANHVHVLLTPHAALSRITEAIKGYTAQKANEVLNRTGKRFWQEESFDHWVRNEEEFRRIMRYIEHNPVAAGLVEKPEYWSWSSATGRLIE